MQTPSPDLRRQLERTVIEARDVTEAGACAALEVLAVHHPESRGYFHRVGSSKRPIPPDQLGRLFQQRSQARLIRFDETPVSQATLDDLDEALWHRFGTPRLTDAPAQWLSKLAMVSQDDAGEWRPTVAGVLMASKEPGRFLTGPLSRRWRIKGKV